MTNTPSGSKRSWDGSADAEQDCRKRLREKEDPKDWRDVHLSSRRRTSYNRRDDDYSRQGRDNHASSRSRDFDSRPHTATNYDARENGLRNGSHRDREGGYDRRVDHRSHRDHPPSSLSNGRGRDNKEDSEREEGEISPRSHPTPSLSPSPRPPSPRSSAKLSQKDSTTDLELSNSPPPVESTLAERRAKRMAILAKYGEETTPVSGISSAVQPAPPVSSISDPMSQLHSSDRTQISNSAKADVLSTKRESMSASPSPDDFALAKEGGEEDAQVKAQAQSDAGEQISAADYDPNQDRREDEGKRIREVKQEEAENVVMIEIEEEEEDDVDDMFAVATTERKKIKKIKKVIKPAPALITTTLDSAADPEGYYSIILGEQLDGGHYQVFSSLGKGMFANVVRARVLTGETGEVGKEVAIKIIRCQESMYKAGLKEVQMLNKLKQADPDDKKHIVRLERTFEHRGHLCIVFESLSMNLRDVVKRFGKDIGLNIRAVRVYTKQLFLALSLLRKCNVMHADIKPDNILVNEQKTVLKLCDLGSASDASENEITPYLVSRFYRAPEIILGVPYDPSLDVWSIGCTLYELYTGKILFPGRSNNQMLLLMMELKGRFNSKMIKKAKFGDVFFDEMGAFVNVDKDRVNGSDVVRKVHITKPTRDLRTRLMPPASAKLQDDEIKSITSFIDLLDRCLALDPSRRITPKDALNHSFIRG